MSHEKTYLRHLYTSHNTAIFIQNYAMVELQWNLLESNGFDVLCCESSDAANEHFLWLINICSHILVLIQITCISN